ncbi:hypothetical protein [Nannocystis sp.]|uniref:hypothetical protein n=1 Tax=Nannocystis sp. TaxID=1962667 RepID=UPI0025E04EE3|nr:hypothetical protein [Nannocystis sp.]MBK7827997.1 hypothetical protein [Nannocystis sp.]
MHPLPPPTEPLSWPLKLVTLVFSGTVASMAIARAGLAGCSAAPPAQVPAKATPVTSQAAQVPAKATPVASQAAPTPTPATPTPATPTPTPTSTSTPVRDLAEAELPDRYFGGAKSDDEVWVPAPARPDPKGQPAQRGQR